MPSIHQTTLQLTLLSALSTTSHAMPLPHLLRRDMGTGAKAGMGVGIAVAAIVAIAVMIFLVMHLRRSAHIKKINQERAILAGEKNADGTDKEDKFAAVPEQPQVSAIPRRNKSVKDRLMGPLYRGSVIDLHPMPARAKIAGAGGAGSKRQSTMTMEGDEAFLNKPWAKDGGESSPRPSFSSKRATRMMMMM